MYTAVVSAVWRLKRDAGMRPDPISKVNKTELGVDRMDGGVKETVPETHVLWVGFLH